MHHLAHNRGIAGIARVHRHRAIAQHGFRPRGGDGNIIARLAQRYRARLIAFDIFICLAPRQTILKMPHMAVNFGILDLQIRNGGFKMRIPVDQSLAAINQPLVIHLNKDLNHRIGKVPRHCERFPIPIAACAKAFELVDNRAARLVFPLPHFGQKRLAAHLAARRRACLGQLALHHHLGGNARMIGAHLPQRVMPAHTVPADQNILQRVVKRVPHVQAARHIGRRNHNGKRLCPRPRIRARRANLILLPQARYPRLGGSCVKVLFHWHRTPSSLPPSHKQPCCKGQGFDFHTGTNIRAAGTRPIPPDPALWTDESGFPMISPPPSARSDPAQCPKPMCWPWPLAAANPPAPMWKTPAPLRE